MDPWTRFGTQNRPEKWIQNHTQNGTKNGTYIWRTKMGVINALQGVAVAAGATLVLAVKGWDAVLLEIDFGRLFWGKG